ncbi:zinc finger protein 91-like [Lytechinus pictus]|uniref:zinc finger protein 91-like n=1 Tax=Lytechinus pictus TaxID=7653 RepID=UPI0030B9FB97
MDETQWLNLKKHLAVYMVEVYCCKLCNDFSSTHKTVVASHMNSVHPGDVEGLMKLDPNEPSTVADTEVQVAEEEDSGSKEEAAGESADLVFAKQVAESKHIEKEILQMLQTNSDVLLQVAGEEHKLMQGGTNKENKRSKKNKKRKKSKKKDESDKKPRRKNKTCKMCNFTTKSSEEFRSHLESHYKDPNSRVCDVCETMFDSYKALLKHTRKGCPPSHPQVYKCEECGKTCHDRRAIIEHMVVHSEERPYSCHICGKSYKTKKILRRHEGIHAMSRDVFQCPECNFKTHWKTNIKRHILEVHQKDSRPLYSCSHCPFTTPNKRYIEKHKFGHWKDCPYMCENCGKMFKAEIDLEDHKQMHVQPDVAWQLIQLQNSEPQLVEETIVQYQPQLQMHAQEIQIHDPNTDLQAVQVTMAEHDEAAKTIVLSQIPVVQYLDIVAGEVVSGQEIQE